MHSQSAPCTSGRTIAVIEQLNRENSPRRTCIGCRKQGVRSELIRLVASRSDPVTVVVDERRRMAGRGAWLHPSEPCLALAVKRRAFGRALSGARLDADVERRLLTDMAPAGVLTPSEPTVQPESGSEI